ncbi:Hypothetical protein CINCED_3A014364 [Cinara cedri]|uniref:Uncharacterized protein n=1 Tax=Cinara cedri TaxID=506608 RepID=A0A5E4N8K8_9HEMI|nr:Hypothetical protein CINCED_3A014364 [Cinara cedri]
MKDVVKIINFIRSRALNQRKFKIFLEEIDAEKGDIVYFINARWLSREKVLKKVFDLKTEVFEFAASKGKSKGGLKSNVDKNRKYYGL